MNVIQFRIRKFLENKRKETMNNQARRKTSRIYELAVAAFSAAKHGNIDELHRILSPETCHTDEEFTAVINSKDREGNTLILKCIHGAASRQVESHNNFAACLNFLISSGVDINAQDSVGRTSLHWCVLYGRVDFLEILQTAGGNLMILDGTGLSPLHLAIGVRSDKLRFKFIDHICSSAPKELLEAKDGHNRSPLYLALSVSAIKTFELLLKEKSDPDGNGPDGRRIIIHSIEKGQRKFTELLLRHGVSLSTKDPDGFTVIHLAACQENSESISVLTETVNKTLLNVKDKLGRTPLIYACLMGFDKNVEILLAQKIWILDQDNQGKTALHHTANNTHCGCTELLCKENRKIINIHDKEGHTAAHDAVLAGNTKILNSLLENGCDVTSKDFAGHSLVHWSTAYGTVGCFEKLVKYQSPIDEPDELGATPLHYGCQKDENQDLNAARFEIVLMLLQKGVSVDRIDKEGRRPFHWAASSGNVKAMQSLLEYDDNLNSRTTEEEMTPLHLTAFQGLEEATEFIVDQNGIELNAQDKRKCTPLFYACLYGHARVTEILLRYGANPNITNRLGESPSHSAALIGSVECLQLLFQSGARLAVYNSQRDTPLHEAASAGKEGAVIFLLENGCSPTVKNATGATPLHYAVAEGYIGITKALLEKGANVNALVTTNETAFVTPLDIALGNSNHQQIQLLQKFGARTGHSIVDNSALVIQHGWKVFKRRFSAADSLYRSNFSDSVSNHDRHELQRNDNKNNDLKDRRNSSLLAEQSHAFFHRLASHDTKDSTLNDNIEDYSLDSNDNEDVFANGDGNKKLEANEYGESLVDNLALSTEDRDTMPSLFETEVVNEMKKSVMERIALNESEIKRTDSLMERIEKLRKQVKDVVEDVHCIAESEEIQLVTLYNDRASRKQRQQQQKQQQHITSLCRLPRLSPSPPER